MEEPNVTVLLKGRETQEYLKLDIDWGEAIIYVDGIEALKVCQVFDGEVIDLYIAPGLHTYLGKSISGSLSSHELITPILGKASQEILDYIAKLNAEEEKRNAK